MVYFFQSFSCSLGKGICSLGICESLISGGKIGRPEFVYVLNSSYIIAKLVCIFYLVLVVIVMWCVPVIFMMTLMRWIRPS